MSIHSKPIIIPVGSFAKSLMSPTTKQPQLKTELEIVPFADAEKNIAFAGKKLEVHVILKMHPVNSVADLTRLIKEISEHQIFLVVHLVFPYWAEGNFMEDFSEQMAKSLSLHNILVLRYDQFSSDAMKRQSLSGMLDQLREEIFHVILTLHEVISFKAGSEMG